MSGTNETKASCKCGAVSFTVSAPAVARVSCHCTICQQFTQSPFSDMCVFRASSISLESEDTVDFQAYRPPPSVQRGKCKQCGGAALERMNIFPFPKLIMVPTANLPPEVVVPSAMHVFYNRRVRDAEDDLPKYVGYWRSQVAFIIHLIKQLWRTRARA